MTMLQQPQMGGLPAVGGIPLASEMLKSLPIKGEIRPPALKVAHGTSDAVHEGKCQPGDIYRSDTGEAVAPRGTDLFFQVLYFSKQIVERGYQGNFLNDKESLKGKQADPFNVVPLIEDPKNPQFNVNLLNPDMREKYYDPSLEAGHPYSGCTVFRNKMVTFFVVPYINGQITFPPLLFPCERTNGKFARKLIGHIFSHLSNEVSKGNESACMWDVIYKVKTDQATNQEGQKYNLLGAVEIHGVNADENIKANCGKYYQDVKAYSDSMRIAFSGEDSETEVTQVKKPVQQIQAPPVQQQVQQPQQQVQQPQQQVQQPQQQVQAPVPQQQVPFSQPAQAPQGVAPQGVAPQGVAPQGVAPQAQGFGGMQVPPVEQPAPKKTRRKRRTKAEIEADKAKVEAQVQQNVVNNPPGNVLSQDYALDEQGDGTIQKENSQASPGVGGVLSPQQIADKMAGK